MKRYIPFFVVVLLLAGTAGEAKAQFQLGARGGYDLEMESALVGVDARFGLNNPSLPLIIAPAFDYFFLDIEDASYYHLDLNVLYPFGINNQSFTPYAGAGLGVGFFDPGENVDSQSDIGLNVVGGAVFGFGQIRPFAQARLKLGGDFDLVTLHGGVLFTL